MDKNGPFNFEEANKLAQILRNLQVSGRAMDVGKAGTMYSGRLGYNFPIGDIEVVRPAGCKLLVTIGNHDLRFSGKLSNVLPQYEGIAGFDLADHTPLWKWYWSIAINESCMIKHRWHNGIHAVHNNILKSGWSFVSGHLHSLKCLPYTDYTGTRYGVDTGTMACIKDNQFIYAENNPLNWRSGFAVLTFNNGKLMPPELAEVVDEDNGLYYFRGQVMKV